MRRRHVAGGRSLSAITVAMVMALAVAGTNAQMPSGPLANTVFDGEVLARGAEQSLQACNAACVGNPNCSGITFIDPNALSSFVRLNRNNPNHRQMTTCTLYKGTLQAVALNTPTSCVAPCTLERRIGEFRTPSERRIERDFAQPKAILVPMPPQVGVVVAPNPAPQPPAGPAPMSGWAAVDGTPSRVSLLGRSNLSASASCPDGSVVTGLGWIGGPISAEMDAERLISAAPTPDGRHVVVARANATFERPFAICAARPAGYQIITTAQALRPGQRARIEASCPSGAVLLGGGVNGGHQDIYISTRGPRPDGAAWSAHVRNDGFALNAPRTVEVSAICAAASAVRGHTVASAAPVRLGPGTRSVQRVTCPSGKRLLSFGFFAGETLAAESAFSVPGEAPSFGDALIFNKSGLIDNVTVNAQLIGLCADFEPY